MKKSDSKPSKETPEQELKRLRKENAKLERQSAAMDAENKKLKAELKAENKKLKAELRKERKKKTCRKSC